MQTLPLALVILAWSIYAPLHDRGIVVGSVVDAAGVPVADAAVTLYRLNFISEVKAGEATTDNRGDFRFDKNHSHLIELQASKRGLGTSPRVKIRLWFRGQDRRLSQPLRLLGAG